MTRNRFFAAFAATLAFFALSEPPALNDVIDGGFAEARAQAECSESALATR